MATELHPPPAPKTFRPTTGERSVGDLLRQLRDDTVTLFRQEVQLAKVETVEKARSFGRSGAVLVAGGVLAFSGFLFLLLGLSNGLTVLLVEAGLSLATASWLSPLIVGVVVAIIGYIMVRKGLNALKEESPVPEQTVRSLQENQQWVKQKLS